MIHDTIRYTIHDTKKIQKLIHDKIHVLTTMTIRLFGYVFY